MKTKNEKLFTETQMKIFAEETVMNLVFCKDGTKAFYGDLKKMIKNANYSEIIKHPAIETDTINELAKTAAENKKMYFKVNNDRWREQQSEQVAYEKVITIIYCNLNP